MDFQAIKALHIIFVVCWFAGLFYMVRLFIYHVEAREKPEAEARILSEQYKLMERKLWFVITTPAMILTIVFGTSMLFYSSAQADYYLHSRWMQLKLLFVLLLLIYHFICHRIMNDLKNDRFKWRSSQLRLWNELATLFLVAIVFLVELQNSIHWIWGTLGFFGVGIALMIAVQVYKKFRTKKH